MASLSLSFSSSILPSPLPLDSSSTSLPPTLRRSQLSYSSFVRCAFTAPPRKSSSSPVYKKGLRRKGDYRSKSDAAPPRKPYSSFPSQQARNRHWENGEYPPNSDANPPGKPYSSFPSQEAKNRHWKKGEYPPTSDADPPRKPYSSFPSQEAKKRHWKKGEYPPTSNAAPERRSYFETKAEYASISPGAAARKPSSSSNSYSSSPEATKRHWKKGEYPGISENWLPGTSKNSPIKNVKKRLERREKAKAWVTTVTEALSDTIFKKQWLQALEVFDMLREQPFYQPKEGTYMKLLVLLGRSGQPHRAHQLFDKMIEEGCLPTPELYTALLAAYCRNNLIDNAFTILNQMKALPSCQPDVFTYSTLIKACVDASQFELLEYLYQEMDERLITPNTVTQNIVLSGYGKVGKYEQMEKVLSGMLESSTCKPDVWTMNIILGVFGNKGQVDIMERWYEKFRNFGIEPETRTFNILIGAYGKKRMYDKMSSVMEYMRKLQFPWTTSTYNNVIEAFADVGDAKNMEYTFDQMRTEGMRADTKTFCCIINGYANAGLFHKVVSSVQLAGKFEIPENTSFYNAVISACAKAEDLMEMDRVFTRMKGNQCQPNSKTYSIMIEAYKKEGMNDRVYDLEQEMKNTVVDFPQESNETEAEAET